MASKNNPDNRGVSVENKKIVLVCEFGKKKKFCEVVGGKLVDKSGKEV